MDDVPFVKSMQAVNSTIQKMCGIDSHMYNGKLGHHYFVNDLGQIIAQEYGNPRVQPHLSEYPEDSGPELSEAQQGSHWLHEIPNKQMTPMACIGNQDYFIYKPAMLRDGCFCIPFRWFMRRGILYAKCWDLHIVTTDSGSVWQVVTCKGLEVSQDDLLKNFLDLQSDHLHYGYALFSDVLNPRTGEILQWTFTNPAEGNHWWNEHNSFLFMPAGLPWEEIHKEYNIHFLCTSNIAPLLEMLDSVVAQLE
ncbi:hypothetical protein CPB84DRAFT_1819491 [Gymnopilus junonius]|uniref:Uncharacterized protein n=1 Tax=Gymnopilus junonius TaxID=109634 RepID=A0A9P5TEB5_GYMJU|nr:hypothetical protein CPB84DRAFT_1819491 [Gymnopilus junonius]